jgi:hypothetical protein
VAGGVGGVKEADVGMGGEVWDLSGRKPEWTNSFADHEAKFVLVSVQSRKNGLANPDSWGGHCWR